MSRALFWFLGSMVLAAGCTPEPLAGSLEQQWMPHSNAVELEEGAAESDLVNRSGSYVPMRAPGDAPDMTVYGFWPHWGDPLATLPWDQLTDVAIFSVTLNSDGSLSDQSFWLDNVDDALALARPYGVKVHLCVTSFSDSTMNSVLASSSRRATAVRNLAQLVNDAGADGVNVDFEGMDAHLKDELVQFVTELKAEVPEVTLATPAADWNGSYDYGALQAAGDGLFIMAYDYSWSGGNPGPVAPLEGQAFGIIDLQWTLQDYRDAGTLDEELILGLPLYGRGWNTTNNRLPGTSTGGSWSEVFTEAVDLGVAHGRNIHTEAAAAYTFPSSTKQVFWDDAATLADKIAWAKDEGLGGVGFWALTYDDTDVTLWREIDQLTHDAAPIPLGPELDAPTPGLADADNTWVARNLDPGDTVHLLQATASGVYAVAGCGFDVDLDHPTLLGTATVDGAGLASFTVPVDAAQDGVTWRLVAVDVDACVATDVQEHPFALETEEEEEVPPTPVSSEVCYPGASGAYDVCVELEPAGTQGSDYVYPASSDARYPAPTAFLRVDDLGASTKLAPNFTRDELVQSWKGDWAVLQVHAVERLQDLRDELGPLNVNSGYRSPGYNESVGGAELSRHQYGDAFDLDPVGVSLSAMYAACEAHGAGFVLTYTTHVHCDWRDDTVEPAFYGPQAAPPPAPVLAARLVRRVDGAWTAPGEGFDCGEPLREWVARDADGVVLATGTGESWEAPHGAAEVEVTVGGRIVVTSPI